jgi:hypothetical protein
MYVKNYFKKQPFNQFFENSVFFFKLNESWIFYACNLSTDSLIELLF